MDINLTKKGKNLVVRYILVLVMLFSTFLLSDSYSEIIDRVIAYVDNQAITLRDFEKFSSEIRKKAKDMTNREIIELMINRTVLLRKGKELFFEGSDEEVINNYIDFKIKYKIIIPDSKIREYYEQNKKLLEDKPYLSVRDQIEKYLFEKELNERLKEHIQELKNSSEIKIIFIP